MNLEEILKQVDEIEKIASDPNYMPDPGIDEVTGLDFARSVRAFIERVKEAEIVIEHLRWCNLGNINNCCACAKDYNNYKEKYK